MNDQSPANVSIYLSLATAIATFTAAAVALGLLHCTRSRHRVEATLLLLSGTLGIVAALATVAAARTSVAGNALIAIGLLVAASWVLLRALQLSYTTRQEPPRYLANRSSPTQSLPVSWTQGGANDNPAAPLGERDRQPFLRRRFWAAAAFFVFAVAFVVAALYPDLLEVFSRSRPVGGGEFEDFCQQNPGAC